MTTAVCPGSFDPPTLGHLDILERAAGLFERVTVAVLVNPDKRGLFSVDERLALLRTATSGWPNVTVDSFSGLLVDYCAGHGIRAVVKGLRAVSDYDYEQQMARMNQRLSGVETVFLTARPEYSFVSSSLIKQVAGLGGDVSSFVSAPVAAALTARLTPPAG